MPVVNILTTILESLSLYALTLLVTKFVFLENLIQGKAGRIYRIVTALFICLLNSIGTGDYSLLIELFIAVDIFVGRKGGIFRKLMASLVVIPIIGIVNGLINAPYAFMVLFAKSDEDISFISSVVFITTIVICAVIYLLNKDKIKGLFVDSENRSLQRWEKLLLCLVGLILLFDPVTIIQFMVTNPLDADASFDINLKGVEFTPEMTVVVVLYTIGQFLMTLTVIILVLVGNRQNFYHNKVSRMQFNIILMMAEIVESRDKNTGGHIKRTAKYVEIIANRLKKNGKFKDLLTDSYISDICVAAPLHDIGKIHVSDTILNKNGPLDDDEFAIMKTHAPAGRELLKNATKHLGEFEYLNIATDMAGYHHEWWDGSVKGYPDGIKGEQIPLSARIMAVADVFDALASKRCYKPAMPIEKAFSIIESEKGTHFDPDVVDAFFDASSEIEKALKEFNEE